MELSDFISQVSNFPALTHPERVKHLAWYLHVHRGQDRFTTTDIRQCYEALHLEVPNISDTLAKLAVKTPKVVLKSGSQYRLEMRVRQELDAKYGSRPITIALEKSLAALPSKLADETKSKYLSEAITCLRAQCFRAAVLMAWNLAYDHLANWILADSVRLAKFNANLPNKPPFNTGTLVSTREHLEFLTEREVVDICERKKAAIITDNLYKTLLHHLERRNISAHPNAIEIRQVNAEDTISSLVDNVVLHLT